MVKNVMNFFSLMNAAIQRQQVEVSVKLCTQTLLVLVYLRNHNYINGFVKHKNGRDCVVLLNYMDGRPVLKQIVPVSTPGRRVFCSMFSLKLFLSRNAKKGPVSHSPYSMPLIFAKGRLYSAVECLRQWHGGEVLCTITV